MELPQVIVKREWPKFLFGPDGNPARFDSPADVPRDYFPTKEEALAYAKRQAEKPVQQVTQPAALAADVQELEEFRRWKERTLKQKENMAKARAARKPKKLAEPDHGPAAGS